MNESDFKKLMISILIIALLVLAFIIIRPILIAILLGLILAYIFSPVYRRLNKRIKSKNLSALIIVLGILIILLAITIILVPIVTRQMLNVYIAMEGIDFSEVLQTTFPKLFQSLSTSADVAAALSSFTADITSIFLVGFQKLIFNLPSILLQSVVVIFTFFFLLRDHDQLRDYFLSVSPFSKEMQARFYHQFEQITNSILYGQLIIGILQGAIAGLGYFIFRVPNALLLTLLTVLVGIIPVIGPWLVWVPIDIYLFMTGHTTAAIGLLIYGLLVLNWIDSLVRPLIVSRMTKMNSALALIGMVGGLYVFGILGLIIGPLILAYLLLLAEFYKERRVKSILIEAAPREQKNPVGEVIESLTGKKK